MVDVGDERDLHMFGTILYGGINLSATTWNLGDIWDGVNHDNDQPKYGGLTNQHKLYRGFYQQKLKRSTNQNRSVTSN